MPAGGVGGVRRGYGERVISTGEMLTLAIARAGFEIYTFRTYPAEIKGGHANFQVRASGKLLLSYGAAVDVLLAFNEEAYQKHIKDVHPGGVVIYDSDSFTPPADQHRKSTRLNSTHTQ